MTGANAVGQGDGVEQPGSCEWCGRVPHGLRGRGSNPSKRLGEQLQQLLLLVVPQLWRCIRAKGDRVEGRVGLSGK